MLCTFLAYVPQPGEGLEYFHHAARFVHVICKGSTRAHVLILTFRQEACALQRRAAPAGSIW